MNTDVIKNDPELYNNYKANIARAMKDAYVQFRRMNKTQHVNYKNMDNIANTAADNFLKKLIEQ